MSTQAQIQNLTAEQLAEIQAQGDAMLQKAKEEQAKAEAPKAKRQPRQAPKSDVKATPEAKPQAKGKGRTKPQSKAQKINFYVSAISRGAFKGHVLHAFTRAWLEMMGAFDGKEISKRQAVLMGGDTMVRYHVRTLCTFEETDKGTLKITDEGKLFFESRRYDKEAYEAFKEMLVNGKVDGVYIKNPQGLKAVA